MPIDRRLLLQGAVLGLGALANPAWAQVAGERGFTHCVASGEPGPRQVMLWTRYVPAASEQARLAWEVSRDAEFGRVVARGEVDATAGRDWCAKPLVTGLAPGEWYFYRFRGPSGDLSPTGRTRTLPEGRVARFNLAVFTCSNLPFGHFNAYGHAAVRDDVDLVVHLGDYLYEYERGRYPSRADTVPGRLIRPEHEIVSLDDYRQRYAAYRLDPQLQRLHQLFPMIMIWDDHETANNSWLDGAQNHQPTTEGPWPARKGAALQACREWLPVSDEPWARYRIGQLADLFRLETRLAGRQKQLDLIEYLNGRADAASAIAQFRDSVWLDPGRTLMGEAQERWLADNLGRSVNQGVTWQVLVQQVLLGSLSWPADIVEVANRTADEAGRAENALELAAANAGLPTGYDAWDGYPAARARMLRASLDAGANLITLAGDSHNAWAFELPLEGTPAGVEFGVHSVTSPGYERSFPMISPRDFAASLVARNRQLKWADTSQRGYLMLELTPEAATGRWTFLSTVKQASLAVAGTHAMSVRPGARIFG